MLYYFLVQGSTFIGVSDSIPGAFISHDIEFLEIAIDGRAMRSSREWSEPRILTECCSQDRTCKCCTWYRDFHTMGCFEVRGNTQDPDSRTYISLWLQVAKWWMSCRADIVSWLSETFSNHQQGIDKQMCWLGRHQGWEVNVRSRKGKCRSSQESLKGRVLILVQATPCVKTTSRRIVTKTKSKQTQHAKHEWL